MSYRWFPGQVKVRSFMDPDLVLPRYRTAVAKWWRGRVAAGCQLSHLDFFRPHYDYKGAGPWFRAVAAQALVADFQMDSGVEISDSAFGMVLNDVVSVRRVHRHGGLHKDSGALFIRPRRRFYRFGPRHWYGSPESDLTDRDDHA